MMTILTGWPPDEPILDLPPDAYEAPPTGLEDDRDDPLAGLVERPVLATCDIERVSVIVRRSGLAEMLGAMLGA